jgi:hypothetical protein
VIPYAEDSGGDALPELRISRRDFGMISPGLSGATYVLLLRGAIPRSDL